MYILDLPQKTGKFSNENKMDKKNKCILENK